MFLPPPPLMWQPKYYGGKNIFLPPNQNIRGGGGDPLVPTPMTLYLSIDTHIHSKGYKVGYFLVYPLECM